MGLKTKIVPLKFTLLEPIGFKLMIPTITVKFVKTNRGKKKKLLFSYHILAYLLMGSLKFHVWGIVGYII